MCDQINLLVNNITGWKSRSQGTGQPFNTFVLSGNKWNVWFYTLEGNSSSTGNIYARKKKSIFRVTLHRCKNCMPGWPIQVLEINPVHLTSFQALSSSRAVLAGGFQLSLDLLLVNRALALKLQISGDKITV